jgi:hypothetical protein
MSDTNQPTTDVSGEWFIRVPGGRIHGPYPASHLTTALQNGTLNDRYSVRQSSAGNWLRPSEIAAVLTTGSIESLPASRAEAPPVHVVEGSAEIVDSLPPNVVDGEPSATGVLLHSTASAFSDASTQRRNSYPLRFLSAGIVLLAVIGVLVVRGVGWRSQELNSPATSTTQVDGPNLHPANPP